MTELLAPAGNEAAGYAALNAGADAVYLGFTRFSAREGAENFSVSTFSAFARYAHLLGAKVYVALNTLVKDSELQAFFYSARTAWENGADALLLQDIFLGRALKEAYPQMTLHLSTQAGCCNVYGAQVARAFGFSRAVLARETPLKDMAAISSVLETEAFVQGALCSCVSGQCYFSSFAGNHSGNRGRCKQPCRKRYSIDRRGFEAPAYALSLSDLCVGRDISALAEAGVSSFKIEGRMRSPAYVAAAVGYYRALLDGAPADEAFERLKRAYNRGDYTRGLAFGQDKTLLSRRVQGHIGAPVGTASVRAGRMYCKSDFAAQKGDAFKILRGGLEVGGAAFLSADRGGFYLSSAARLCAGDEVRVTTDTAANAAALAGGRRRPVAVEATVLCGRPVRLACGDFVLEGETAQPARSAPLSRERICECLQKTDRFPFAPEVCVLTDGAFFSVGALNALRRAFYEGLADRLAPPRPRLPETVLPGRTTDPDGAETIKNDGGMAVIVTDGAAMSEADMEGVRTLIYKPRNYADLRPPQAGGRAVCLYLPAFFTADDEALIAPFLGRFDAIYCEGTYGIALARKYRIGLFAGTGWNLSNRIAADGAAQAAARFALSKELTIAEADALARAGAYTAAAGGIKLMDLAYCPFSAACSGCDRRDAYTLTDEAGRAFVLRRYRMSGNCRFEVYNCVPLAAAGGRCAPLVDCTQGDVCDIAYVRGDGAERPGATHGHAQRSLL